MLPNSIKQIEIVWSEVHSRFSMLKANPTHPIMTAMTPTNIEMAVVIIVTIMIVSPQLKCPLYHNWVIESIGSYFSMMIVLAEYDL